MQQHRPLAQSVCHQVLLHRRLADRELLVPEPAGVLAAADRRLGHGQTQEGLEHVGGGGFGHLGLASSLGYQGAHRTTLITRRTARPITDPLTDRH
jgi:hypothetical protein